MPYSCVSDHLIPMLSRLSTVARRTSVVAARHFSTASIIPAVNKITSAVTAIPTTKLVRAMSTDRKSSSSGAVKPTAPDPTKIDQTSSSWAILMTAAPSVPAHLANPTAVHTAACSCGGLSIKVTGDPIRVSMCHCLECQRRTGSVFGTQCRYALEKVDFGPNPVVPQPQKEGENSGGASAAAVPPVKTATSSGTTTAKQYTRKGDSGGTITFTFCGMSTTTDRFLLFETCISLC